ncbi:DsbA family protein [Phenylobacterium sp.]|uniref:DsbA family protein n=1 Tax=Phenylobacterium sp. TaxID=1871053 RepID=UPI0035B15555
MDGRHLIYFSDPMCSWCYGFSPVIEDIRETFGDKLPIRVVMGGLRPGTEEPLSEDAKRSLRDHWTHVTEASGQPFDESVLDREGFIYDTDPAARAVVLLRRNHPNLALEYLRRLQAAFYAENRDVTSLEVLADIAADLGVRRDAFLHQLDTVDARQETWRDYAISQRAGVTGFPTLVAGPNDEGVYGVVTRGYAPADQVLAVLRAWMADAA